MNDITALNSGSLFAGRYRIDCLLQASELGAVYRARHKGTQAVYALKLLSPAHASDEAARARFREEVGAAARVESDHVVAIAEVDVDAQTGSPFVVTEPIEGEDLASFRARCGRLAPTEALAYMLQVAAALDTAHKAGVVHCGLRPENIFLCELPNGPPQIKVTDFCLARFVQDATDGTGGGGFFSALYAAPELTTGGAKPGPSTDVWAFGLVTFTLLVGRPYWEAQSLAALRTEVLLPPHSEPPSNRAMRAGVVLDDAFDDWFFHCVIPDPGARFAGVIDACRALGHALDLGGESPAPPAGTGLDAHGASVPVNVSTYDVEAREAAALSSADHAASSGARESADPAPTGARTPRRGRWWLQALVMVAPLVAAYGAYRAGLMHALWRLSTGRSAFAVRLTDPVLLAGDLPLPSRPLIDGAYLYVLDRPQLREAAIFRLPRTGGAPSEIVRERDAISDFAIDERHVYWTVPSRVMRAPKDGGPSETLISGVAGATPIAVSATRVFFATPSGISSLPKSGGAAERIVETREPARFLVLDDAAIYWMDASGSVFKAAVGGGAAVPLYVGSALAAVGRPLVLSAHDVVWAADGHVMRVPKAGGTPQRLLAATDPVAGLALGGDSVFASTLGHDVLRLPIAGGKPEKVITGRFVLWLSVDSNGIYWTDNASVWASAASDLW